MPRVSDLKRSLSKAGQSLRLFTLGHKGVTQKEGVAAIARSLEDGLDTVVSERGSSLSGGQRQCIGIARALLKDAPIVILDEPTSSMDSHTERLVLTGIERLTEGRTVLVIAHRLATVQNADAVALLRGGKIVEHGRPSELLRRRSEFAEMVAIQTVALPDGRRHADRGTRPPAGGRSA